MSELTPQSSDASRGRRRRSAMSTDWLLALTLTGLILDVALVYGLLWPLEYSEHPEVPFGYQPLATVFGNDRDGQVRFIVAVLSSYAAFAAAALVARRVAGRRACWLVLGGTVVLAATLLPTNPAGAQDVYHNIADARTLWLYGDNPAVTPPNVHSDDPLYGFIPDWTDTPSSYGPLWYVISGAPIPFAGDDLWANILGQKLVTTAFLVITTAMAMLIVGRLQPGAAPLAGVLVGWNPLLLFETAVSAHNDIVMVAFALGALYAAVRRWWWAVFPMLALAVAVKYVMVVIAPIVFCWMLLRRDVPRTQLALSVLLGALTGAAIYAPFLADGALLDTLRGEGSRYLSSTGSALASVLIQRLEMDPEDATRAMRVILVGVFAVGYLALLARIRRHPSYRFLAVTSAAAVFLFLVTVKWWFWPWYLTWLVPLAALAPRRGGALLAALFSMTAMLLYAAYYWNVYDEWHYKQQLVFMTVFAGPLALACLLMLWPPAARLSAWIRGAHRPWPRSSTDADPAG